MPNSSLEEDDRRKTRGLDTGGAASLVERWTLPPSWHRRRQDLDFTKTLVLGSSLPGAVSSELLEPFLVPHNSLFQELKVL